MYYKFFFSYKNWAANSKKKKRQKTCDVNMINYLKNLNEIMIFTKGKEMNIIIIYYQKLETKTLLFKKKKFLMFFKIIQYAEEAVEIAKGIIKVYTFVQRMAKEVECHFLYAYSKESVYKQAFTY